MGISKALWVFVSPYYRVVFMFSDTQNVVFVANWLMWIKIALNNKFWLVSYPHFIKISFKLIKCGLSNSLKRDLRPFSEFTRVWTIFTFTASKNELWRLPLIDWRFHWGQFYLSINIESKSYQWQPPKCIYVGCQWKNGPNLSKFWEWPRITF